MRGGEEGGEVKGYGKIGDMGTTPYCSNTVTPDS